MNNDAHEGVLAEALRTRDVDRWVAAMAPDVTLHSPMLSAPFRGRQVAHDLYSVLFDRFGRFDITHQSRSGDTEVIAFRTWIGRHTIEGVDILRYDSQGAIIEIRNFMRPLNAVAVFANATGPGFARKRGRAAATLTWAMTRPLRVLFAIVDRVAPKLLPLR